MPTMADMFRGAWRLESPSPGGAVGLAVWQVLICQHAWSALTPTCRAALVAVAENPSAAMHPGTRSALVRHGLLGEDGVTEVGRRVVHYRPDVDVRREGS